MTTATATLADFLLARVVDDIVLARAIQAQAVTDGFTVDDPRRPELTLAARVLADCAARRAIVAMGGSKCAGALDDYVEGFKEDFGFAPDTHYPDGYANGCDGCSAAESANSDHAAVLRHLASVYCDHLDFDPTWTVS